MIKVWDYLAEYEQEREEVRSAIDGVLESGQLILGQNVVEFEKEFAASTGASYGIGVNSGTDALFLGLLAIGIGAGDEVITVANTAVPTVSAIEATGARARFVDIDPATFLMDTSQLERALTTKTKAILPVHLYGQCVDMDAVNSFAEHHGLRVLEDCAQSHAAQQNTRVAGSLAEISAFSFYPTKILGTYGDGGMVVTSEESLMEKCRRLRFYGMETQYFSVEKGFNSRLDELHAAILRKKLTHLDAYVLRRREIAARYTEALKDSGLGLPSEAAGNRHSYYLYVCRHPERDKILEELKERQIFLNVSYRWPIHIMPAFSHLGYREGDLPQTEKAANEIFSLPMYPSLTDDQIETTIETLKAVIKV